MSSSGKLFESGEAALAAANSALAHTSPSFSDRDRVLDDPLPVPGEARIAELKLSLRERLKCLVASPAELHPDNGQLDP